MEKPSLRAAVPPLKERRWTPEAQRQILRHELMDIALYRQLVSCELDAALLKVLEAEFDAFLAQPHDLDAVYCLRFPPMPAHNRWLISACASRYHLRTSSFDEDERRFCVVYKHPKDAARPVLRLDDYVHAMVYYEPAPAPEAENHAGRRAKAARRDSASEGYDFEAHELDRVHDYSRWTVAGGASVSVRSENGYECEIAHCHDHIVEITDLSVEVELAEAIPEAAAIRPLPAGFLVVLRSAEAAQALVGRCVGSESVEKDASNGVQRLRCSSRVLSELQRRPNGGGAGRGGAPRALQAALRGLGGPSRGSRIPPRPPTKDRESVN